MSTIVITVVKDVLNLFSSGFVSGIESSEIWLFGHFDALLLQSSSSALSSGWFYGFFQKMEILALAFAVPLFLVGLLAATFNNSGSYLIRLVMVYLPISIVGSGVFLFIFQSLSSAIDEMSSWLVNSEHFSLDSFTAIASGISVQGGAPDPVPFLLVLIVGILSVLGSLSLYFELLLRQGVMLILGAFIPFAFLSVFLSSSRSALYRYIEVTIGVVLSKLVVVVLLCLGSVLVLHQGSDAGFSESIIGVAMVILASLSPFLLFGLIPFAHIDHQAQLSRSARKVAGGFARQGLFISGGSAPVTRTEIPIANATVVPSYLRSKELL